MINFTRVTERFLKQLLQGIEDGLTAARDGGDGGGGTGVMDIESTAAAAASTGATTGAEASQ